MTDLTFSEIEKINEARERRLIEAALKSSTQKFRGSYEAKKNHDEKYQLRSVSNHAYQN